MCRSTLDGGRRCPSHTDPVLIANRNARRREKYAKAHLKSKGQHTEAGNQVSHSVSTQGFEHSLFGYKSNDKVLYQKVNDGNENAFGLSAQEYKGLLVDTGYVSAQQTSGLLNYTKLDEDSYKEFGFKDPEEPRYTQVEFTQLKDFSKAELEEHSLAEKKALKTFTSNDYKWINTALYGKGTLKSETEQEAQNYKSNYDDKTDSIDYSPIPFEKQTPSRLKDVVQALDSALDKAPKQQRILYRGMFSYHPAWGSPDELSKYIDKNYAIGKEFKFDGYQSTTYNPTMAAASASHGGLIFEISTPSGVNVTSVSEYDTEEECILPRDSRYMIVGIHKDVNFISQIGKESHHPDYREGVTIIQMVEITETGHVKNETNFTSPSELKPEQHKTVG